ncbi:hypothetical protein HQ45_08500 [Porphyromonas crevioricanis]|uniref:DUF4834 domain-containing protein n=3 Tax=Porphyromonas crevioricanis TaxID=393921 RepID=A0AB34PFM8_9PORP|nr:DUF4834 family protein [Porphyromonas crevioricanis]KGN88728.1 hypothetical protein HQ45_08500 [Porphyromonas crevioricanis]KGN93902.1 hypothetical protein HQ38_07765 [Porphyromonas crevioricanis]
MEFLLVAIVLFFLLYLLRPLIWRWLSGRAIKHLNNMFGQQQAQQERKGKKQSEMSGSTIKKKVDLKEIDKKRFDKGEGEYVDFEDVK